MNVCLCVCVFVCLCVCQRKNDSKAGNRTRVSCVTGKNTNHYTTSEGLVFIAHGYRVEAGIVTIGKKQRAG